MDLKELIVLVEEKTQKLIDKYDLDHNNGEFYFQPYDSLNDTNLFLTVEAPNHTTTQGNMPLQEFLDAYNLGYTSIYTAPCFSSHECEAAVATLLSDFLYDTMDSRENWEDTFDTLWNDEFKKRNKFTVKEFITMLEEDDEFFEDVLSKIKSEPLDVDDV